MRERVLLHFREAKNTGGEERVHGRGNGVPKGVGVPRHVEVRIGLPDRRDIVPGKIGWSTSRGAVPGRGGGVSLRGLERLQRGLQCQ